MNVLAALRDATTRLAAAGVASPALDASVLLAHALGTAKHTLRTEPDRALSDDERARFDAAVRQRERRRPVSQIVGRAEFRSLDFSVTDAVLSPRPETEMLVEGALAAIAGIAASRVAELGVGSGCVAVSIAVAAPHARVFATDVSGAALLVAERNVALHGVGDRVTLLRGDMAAPLRAHAPFDVIVSNPPYVRRSEAGELDPEVLWDPACAVFCDGEPAAVYERVARDCADLVRPGGALLCELPGDGVDPICTAVSTVAGWRDASVGVDLAGLPRLLRLIGQPTQ